MNPRDYVRLYPHGELDLDAHGFFGSRVGSLPAETAGVDMAPKFFVRRARLELGGELFERIAFNVGLDLAANPAIDGARVDGTQTRVALADAWASVDGGRGVHLMMGAFQAPFSLENRSATSDLPMMERNIAIRGFAMPGGRVLGAAHGGSTQHEILHWDTGAFGAESITPGEFERDFDGIGRFVVKPLAASASALRDLQIGVSARAGVRNPRDRVDDVPSINSSQGFALWRPTHLDGAGRTLHVIPSGLQWSAGLELRIPIRAFVIRSEAYWVSRATREAIDGTQATNSERFGRIRGVGWYTEISAWILQLAGLVDGGAPTLGSYPRASHLELARLTPPSERHGFEIAALAAGINATYDGASRGGDPDPSTPAAGIRIYQFGAAVNYWHSNHFRVSINGNGYYAPGSSSADNLAVMPGTSPAIARIPARTRCTSSRRGRRCCFRFRPSPNASRVDSQRTNTSSSNFALTHSGNECLVGRGAAK